MENPTTPRASPAPREDDALRKRLLRRIAWVGGVMLGLLAGWAIFEAIQRPAPQMPPMARAPDENVGSRALTAPPEKEAVEEAKETPKREETPPAREAQEAKPQEPPAVAEESKLALSPVKPLTPPASARQTAIKPSESLMATPKPDARKEVARVHPPERTETLASKPLTKAMEASAHRFFLQIGVFSEHANAEELAEKLKAAGIPVRLETRVAAGPFASQRELEAARAKLKELGIAEGLLVRR
ncbi:MAG: SPOR domain-containing protein [Rhodocyclaceae bacterium]|nr:SPOR domain-containing protein [Rhodocyclaceae bacterium]